MNHPIESSLVLSDVDFAGLMALSPPPELRAELERAIVVPLDSMWPGIVTMGSRVRYRDDLSGQEREVVVVFPDEADPGRGKVSVLAPVGAALIGLAEGQTIEWAFPDGRPRHLSVLAVTAPTGAERQDAAH